MINIAALTESDKGRAVRYTASGGDKIENGKITSWNWRYIFVRYYEQIKPTHRLRTGETSEATDPKDLEWI